MMTKMTTMMKTMVMTKMTTMMKTMMTTKMTTMMKTMMMMPRWSKSRADDFGGTRESWRSPPFLALVAMNNSDGDDDDDDDDDDDGVGGDGDNAVSW